MNCVMLVSFQVLMNGFLMKSFKPVRALRKGDPLSSLLFAICAEGFSGLIRRASLRGQLQGLQIGV